MSAIDAVNAAHAGEDRAPGMMSGMDTSMTKPFLRA